MLILVNALRINSPWKFPFESNNTKRVPFYTMSRTFNVDMMIAKEKFSHKDLPQLNTHFVPVRSPTNGNHTARYSMHLIIPKRTFGLKSDSGPSKLGFGGPSGQLDYVRILQIGPAPFAQV